MPKSVMAMITIFDDGGFSPVDPGFGRPGGGGRPDQGLPGGRPHPGGGPIYHPGHPDHGLPSEQPGIDNSLPWAPGSPDQGLPVPPGVQPPAAPGGALKDKLVVLWHLPGQTAWHGKVIDPSAPRPDQELPETGEPK